MIAWLTVALWLGFNAAFVAFMAWRGYRKAARRKRTKAKRERIYSNYRRALHNT